MPQGWPSSLAESAPFCKCGEQVAGVHDSHFLSCKRLCPTALRHRHDSVVRLAADLFRKAGAPVRIEPRPIDGKKVAPDCEVILPGERLLFDVVIPHPASKSRTSTQPLHAAHVAERQKEVKYEALAKKIGAKFLPFGVEAYGAVGDKAAEVLKKFHEFAATSIATPSLWCLKSFASQARSPFRQGTPTPSCTVRCSWARSRARSLPFSQVLTRLARPHLSPLPLPPLLLLLPLPPF